MSNRLNMCYFGITGLFLYFKSLLVRFAYLTVTTFFKKIFLHADFILFLLLDSRHSLEKFSSENLQVDA